MKPEGKEITENFNRIAPRYDLLNRLFSLTVDQYWRRKLIQSVKSEQAGLVLDACCGTGDVMLIFCKQKSQSAIVGLDASNGMLKIATGKAMKSGRLGQISFVQGDALNAPFADNTFDIVVNGFGLRNEQSIEDAISEMVRVLRPGGVLSLLEFAPSDQVFFSRFYQFYLGTVMPAMAQWISGSRKSYEYLAQTVMTFIKPAEIQSIMKDCGLMDVAGCRLTGGMAYIYRGKKHA